MSSKESRLVIPARVRVEEVKSLPFMNSVPVDDLGYFANLMSRFTLNAGETLYEMGQASEYVFVILSGIGIETWTPRSKNVHTAVLVEAGMTIGLYGVAVDRDTAWQDAKHPTSVYSITQMELGAISWESNFASYERGGPLAVSRMREQVWHENQVTDHFQQIIYLSVSQRVVRVLWMICQRVNGRIQMKQSTIADLCGATREAVGEVLRRLKEQDVIESGRGWLEILQPQAIQEMLDTILDDTRALAAA